MSGKLAAKRAEGIWEISISDFMTVTTWTRMQAG